MRVTSHLAVALVALASMGCSPVLGLIARAAQRLGGPQRVALEVGQRVDGSTRDAPDRFRPTCGAPDGGGDRSYTLRVPETGDYRIDVNARYDAVLALFDAEGQCLDCNDDSGRTTHSTLERELVSGVEYVVVVDGYRGATGDFTLEVQRIVPPTPDVVGEALELGRWREGSTVGRGDGVTPPCGAEPGSPEQLWTFTPEQSGRHAVTVRAGFDSVLAVYPPAGEGETPLACNDDYRSARMSRVEVELEAGRTYRVFVDGKAGASGRYTVAAARPRGRAQAVRGVLALGRPVTGDTRRASDRYSFGCGVSPGSRDEGWLFRPSEAGRYRFVLEPSYDGALGLFEHSGREALACAPAGAHEASAEGAPPIEAARSAAEASPADRPVAVAAAPVVLEMDLSRGRVVRVVVDGRAGAAGAYRLRVEHGTEPPAEPVGGVGAQTPAGPGEAQRPAAAP